MLIRSLGGLAVASLCAASLWQIVRPSMPRLLYNPSPSAPIGWYRLHPDTPFRKGDLVAAWPTQNALDIALERQYFPPNIPLIKTVWAVSGEQICHENGQVYVHGQPPLRVLKQDGLSRPLPSKDGCYVISKDEVFLISNDVQTSFDSRYFGPVPRGNILGRIDYLGRWKSRSERLEAGRG